MTTPSPAALDYRSKLEAMRPEMRRLERWLYRRLDAANGAPTVDEASSALALTAERIVELADNHHWIEAYGDRADLAAMKLTADGE